MAPWVNMHGAWPAGLAWLGLICAGETALLLFGAASRLPKPAVLRLWAALGLAAAATLVNPYGFHIWEVPLKLTSSPEMSAVIAEWQRPGLAHWLDIRHVGAWIFLLAILAAPRRLADRCAGRARLRRAGAERQAPHGPGDDRRRAHRGRPVQRALGEMGEMGDMGNMGNMGTQEK